MHNAHVWHLLGVDVPNLLPESVFGSRFPRPAGRLIWSSLLFVVGLVVAYAWMKRPKKSDEKVTWAQATLGAFFVWVMLTLGFGVIPSEWIVFGNAYLKFDSSTYLVRVDQFAGGLPPFDITRDKFVDLVATLINVVSLGLVVYFFAAWQKRKVAEPAGEETGDETPKGSPLARLRARRAGGTSAYGRPVTTSE